MTTISKLFTWTSFPPHETAANDTAEFNQIINLLTAGITNRRVYIQFSDATLPPLRLNQVSGGDIADFYQSATEKLYIDYLGRVGSTIATGTAFATVDSTTKVANLNADLIDGVLGSLFIDNATANQQAKSTFTIVKNALGAENLIIDVDNNIVTFKRSSDNATIFTIENLNSATRLLNLPSTLDTEVAYTPAAANDLINYTYWTANKSAWIPQGHHAADLAVNAIITQWICPVSSLYTLTKLAGINITTINAASGNIITFYKNNTSLGTLTWVDGTAAFTVKTSDIADVALVEGDILRAKLTTAGGTPDFTASFYITM